MFVLAPGDCFGESICGWRKEEEEADTSEPDVKLLTSDGPDDKCFLTGFSRGSWGEQRQAEPTECLRTPNDNASDTGTVKSRALIWGKGSDANNI